MGRNVTFESVLTEQDFDRVWDYLELRFGYSKTWRHACHEYVYNRKAVFDFYKRNPVADFLFFCRREVDPLLNAALCRNEYHPTFMRLLYWMFHDRIAQQ